MLVLEEGEYRLFSCVSEKGTVTSKVIEGFAVELSEVVREG